MEYYRAFRILSRARGFTSNGVSLPITFEAMDRFSIRYDYEEDFDDFLQVITGIDDEYLRGESKRRAAEDRSAKRKKKHGGKNK